jgi:hypothetical protein
VLLETLEDCLKPGLAGARRDRITPWADLMVPGNLLDAPQRLGLMASFGVLQSALVF